MQINIEPDENVVRDAVANAWRDAFTAPRYSSENVPDGLRIIRAAVKDTISKMDVSEIVRKLSAEMLESIVLAELDLELRRYIKRVVKDMRNHNDLFDKSQVEKIMK